MIFRTLFISLTIAVFSSVAAVSAPSPLLNKTIHLSYTGYAPVEGGNNFPRFWTITLYISSQGRVFKRASSIAGRQHGSKDIVGGNFHFSGNQLVSATRFGTGAVQITVGFRDNFQSCNVDIKAGTAEGAPFRWRSMSGKMRTATGPRVFSDQRCTIEAGNAFAN